MNNILGEYVFENFTLINPLNRDIDDYYLTIMHEYAHMLLSLQSNVGIMQYCLNRLPLQKLHSDTRKILSHFLCKHSIKVQEAIAVFTECFVKLIDDGDDGKEALKQYIYKLKCTNGTYYKYLEKLLPILKIMREEKSSENIKKAYSAVFQCAVYAMNSKIHTLDVEIFKSKDVLEKKITEASFSKEYLPNSRFFDIIRKLKTAQNCQQIVDLVGSSIKSPTLEECKSNLQEIKEFLLRLFSGVEYYKDSLERIICREISPNDLLTMQLPMAFSGDVLGKYAKKASLEELKPKCEDTMLFILGNIESALKQMLKNDEQITEALKEFQHYKVDLTQEFVLLYSIRQKTIFMAMISSSDVQGLLNSGNGGNDNTASIIVVNYKNYNYQSDEIEQHPVIKRNVFIYCDRTYKNFIPYYDHWKDRDLYYSWIEYDKVLILTIKIADQKFMLLPVNLAVYNEAQIDITNRHNMSFSKEIGESIEAQIDTVVSYLIFGEVFFQQTIHRYIDPEYTKELFKIVPNSEDESL